MTNFVNQNKIYKNTIYICRAENTLNYIQTQELKVSDCIKLYFPYLIKLDIYSIPLLLEKRRLLVSNSKEMINSGFERDNNNVNLFYQIFEKKTSDITYIHKGLSKLDLILKPDIIYNLPLDIVFKILHATISVPLIKYNPSKKMENVYRLYTNKVSTKGRKIPYLTKSQIFKLMKTVGRSKGVACYIMHKHKSKTIPIVCTFYNNAHIKSL